MEDICRTVRVQKCQNKRIIFPKCLHSHDLIVASWELQLEGHLFGSCFGYPLTFSVPRLSGDITRRISWLFSLRMLFKGLQYYKNIILGKIDSRRRRGWQKMKWLDRITDSMEMNLNKLREMMEDRGVWHATVHGVTKELDTI